MNITELITRLEEIKQSHGDLPVLMFAQEGNSHTSLCIEKVEPLVYPAFGKNKEGITQFYFAALYNDGLIL